MTRFKAHRARLELARPYLKQLLFGLILMLCTVAIELTFPKAIAFMIDNAGTDIHSQWLGWIIVGLILLFGLQSVGLATQQYVFESTGNKIVRNIRQTLYTHIIHKNIGFFDDNKVGELCNRLSADVEVLQDALSSNLAMAIRALIVVIGGGILLISISPTLSLLLLIVVPIGIVLTKHIGTQLSQKSKDLQAKLADTGTIAQENFTNIRLVHAFNQKRKSLHTYQKSNDKALKSSLVTARLFAVFQGYMSFIRYLALLVILWMGGNLIINAQISVGELTSFILYTGMVASSATSLSAFWGAWMRSIGSTERIFELLAETQTDRASDHKISRSDSAKNRRHVTGNIAFADVNFAYPTRPDVQTLHHLNFHINSGERVAFVGSSGAGKSTIANLLLGFYQPSSGQVLFDGENAQDIGVDALRDQIAIVEQEPDLFSGSILENITYSMPEGELDMQAVISSAKQAFAHDFIQALPEQYNTIVGERGVQLSGGQKQRIAIARALIKDPQILILDEATSALDSESEAQVQAALAHLMIGRTTIMIAHRLSTVIQADRIIVMDKGRILQQGNHAVLSQEKDSFYHRLMKKQLGTVSIG